jgi:hypothetical protein
VERKYVCTLFTFQKTPITIIEMGNEKSNLESIEIKSDVVEVTNSWTLKQAGCSTSSAQYSVFSSPVDSSSSLELASKVNT